MAGYKIFFKKSVWKDFESIPKNDLRKIMKLIIGKRSKAIRMSKVVWAGEIPPSPGAISDYLFNPR